MLNGTSKVNTRKNRRTNGQTDGQRDGKIDLQKALAQWADALKVKVNRISVVILAPKTMSLLFLHLKKIFKQIGQSSGASPWRVCYQRGLPRLV